MSYELPAGSYRLVWISSQRSTPEALSGALSLFAPLELPERNLCSKLMRRFSV